MRFNLETGFLGDAMQCPVETRFGPSAEGEVRDITACGANQVVVMLGEGFGEFVASELVVGHDAGDHAGVLKDNQISVGAGLCEPFAPGEDLGQGHWSTARTERCDERPSTLRVALIRVSEESVNLVVELVSCHGRNPGNGSSADDGGGDRRGSSDHQPG